MTNMFASTITRSPDSVDGLPLAPAADPALVGAPGFSIGSLALGLFLSGFNHSIPSNLAGQLPIMIFCGAVLLFVAAIWSIPRGEGTLATVFGLFGAFWLSFSTLAVGLTHNWFGELSDKAQRDAQASFLRIWLVAMVVLTFPTLCMPLVYRLLFPVVDVSLVTLLLQSPSPNRARCGRPGHPPVRSRGDLRHIHYRDLYVCQRYERWHRRQARPQNRPLLRR